MIIPLDIDYDNLIKMHPRVSAVLPPNILQYMKGADAKTFAHHNDVWKHNVTINAKKNIPKHGWINDGFSEFARNKAVIAIGSGPSLKKNQELLKMVSLVDGTKRQENQEFIFMASNHQIKPCLEAGIIPHFAMVADGAEALVDQFDVGDAGKHTILIAAVTTHPKVIAKWPGPVRFVSQQNAVVRGFLKDAGVDMPKENCVTEGGNILNMSFSLSIGLFRTPVWMCVGNDLSFTSEGTVEERRLAYYADGDYSTNLVSKRDEAKSHFAWGGISFANDQFLSPTDYVNLDVVYTSPQMFVYKSWLESNALILWDAKVKFKIYNCSEGGILGVNIREGIDGYDEKMNGRNWCLMDEITNNKWRTRRLSDAVEEFHKAREILNGEGIWLPKPIEQVQNLNQFNQQMIVH